MSNFNWLHLSDIHFNFTNYDTKKMRKIFLLFLEEKVKEFPIDFVVITGDFTYKGQNYKSEVAEFLTEILNICNLTKNDLFMIPGNHDLKRGQLRNIVIKDIQSKPVYSDFPEDVEQQLLNGQADFFSFYEDIKGIPTDFKEKIHWLYKGDGYNIIHLNTALTCGRDSEEGNLKINLNRLNEVLSEIEDSPNLNIAIGHHSLDCFSIKERQKIFNEFSDNNILLYSCGHIHESAISVNADGSKQIATIVCGSNMVDDYNKVGCVINSYNEHRNSVTVCYFCWDNANQQWVPDMAVGRNVQNGRIVLELDKEEEGEYETIDTDEFSRFIVEFQQVLDQKNETSTKVMALDILDKFKNMKCNKAVLRQFEHYCIYFPIVNDTMKSTYFTPIENRDALVGVVVEEYNKVLDLYNNGDQIFEEMVRKIFDKYNDKFKMSLSEPKLKLYIKIFIFWLINECDIFDDMKE